MIDDIAKCSDYTVLKPDATKDVVEQLCLEAKESNCASVCINPYYISLAADLLKDSDVKVTTVVGFPLGATIKEVKAYEALTAIQNGADEIDMVINIAALKNGDYDDVKSDIAMVLEVCRKNNAILKVIIETCLLTDSEKQIASKLIVEVGADFVKTSTGFSNGGATIEDIKLIKETVGDEALIKASGGIRDYEIAVAMISAGANRLGTSKLIKK